MRTRSTVLALALVPSLASAQQSACPNEPLSENIGGGSPGTFGVPQLVASGLPAANFPFSIRLVDEP